MEFQFESLGPLLRSVVLVFLIGFTLALLALVVVLAALPGRIARSSNHPQADAVNICGWLGLPTGILWVIAMVWAYLRSPADVESKLSAIDDRNQLDNQLAALEQAVSSLELSQSGARQ